MKSSVSLTSMILAAGISLAGAGVAYADPVWDRIESSGSIVCGAIPNDPVGSWYDRPTGQWEGYEIDLCRAIAADLSTEMGKEIKPEFRETSWKTVVLDIQSNKIDIWPGMSATPEREKALSMIGPMYGLAFCGVTSKSFTFDGTWEGLNKPEVRVATVTGTSLETAFKTFAPNATHVTLTEYAEVTLAVQSGRADIMGADALRCLERHRQAGDRLLIISASAHFLVSAIGRRLGVDEVLAIDIEERDGLYTGRTRGTLTYREGKVRRLAAWLAQEGETLAGATCYSDSRNALPLLSRVDRPHTVNPDPALLGHAREAGWPVLEWR